MSAINSALLGNPLRFEQTKKKRKREEGNNLQLSAIVIVQIVALHKLLQLNHQHKSRSLHRIALLAADRKDTVVNSGEARRSTRLMLLRERGGNIFIVDGFYRCPSRAATSLLIILSHISSLCIQQKNFLDE